MEGFSQNVVTFKELFKYNNNQRCLSANERREKFLQEQKEKRHQLVDATRHKFQHFVSANDEIQEMECEELQSKKEKFKFTLMNTEWFTDIPDDLEENWLVKCAPAGFRVMLVSRRKLTVCYDNKGRSVLKLKSNFSGGGGGRDIPNGITILDCIYNKATKTIFILDCLCWNNMSMIDTDAEFRFFWLKSKFTEDLELSSCKNYKFVVMDHMWAQKPLIQDAMFRSFCANDHTYYYDGIVFYHKESHYIFGDTPLVGWLASFMLTELIQIDVSPEHLVKIPDNYKGVYDYIQNLKFKNKKVKRKKIQKHIDSGEMEIT